MVKILRFRITLTMNSWILIYLTHYLKIRLYYRCEDHRRLCPRKCREDVFNSSKIVRTKELQYNVALRFSIVQRPIYVCNPMHAYIQVMLRRRHHQIYTPIQCERIEEVCTRKLGIIESQSAQIYQISHSHHHLALLNSRRCHIARSC